MTGDPNANKAGTTESLAEWRAAERDTEAARKAAQVATLALAAARAAEEAATETEAAAVSAAEATERARSAAGLARHAAGQAAEAARILTVEAEGDKVRANHEVANAEAAESGARDRFHDAEDRARKPR